MYVILKQKSVGAVPPIWKTAIIVPVFKKGDPTDVQNYRPISLTCVASKIMERVIVQQMTSYFMKCNLISNSQHGFIVNRSTCTNLLESFNDWTLALQDRTGITVVYIDFAKAFDSVPHDKLVHRLKTYGINGQLLLWIKNFLSDRNHCTRVGNVESTILPLLSGVIQGSGIGPLMFVMYINELADILREAGVTVRFFADDLKMYARITNCVDVTVMQNALDRLVDWADLWQLQISITKCNSMHIGRQPPFSVDLKIRDLSLPVVNSCRDLGILVCSSLSHSSHIANIINVASQRSNLILRTFVTRDIATLKSAFVTYVRPLLEYNSVVWSPQYISDIRALEKVQRRFTKRLPSLHQLPYSRRIEQLGLQSLELRRLINDLVMCYKIVFGLTCLKMSDYFIFSPVCVTRGHPYKLFVPRTVVNTRKHYFCIRVIEPWNNLNCATVDFSSLRRFRCFLRRTDLSQYLKHYD